MCDLGSRDNVSLANGLEGVDSAGILLHDLHDFAETALTHDLQQVKVLHLQAALPVLNERDTNLDRATTELEIQPFGTQLTSLAFLFCVSGGGLLVVLLAQLGVLHEWLSFLKPRVHLGRSQEDILTAASTRPGRRVAQVQLNIQLGLSRNVELEGCAVTRPQGVFGSTRYGIHENLVLLEIKKGVWEISGGITTVCGGGSVNASAGGLGPTGLHKGARLGVGGV